MKVKVIETGEIVEVNNERSLIDYARGVYTEKSSGRKFMEFELEFIQEKTNNNIDWELRRYEIAKFMLPVVCELRNVYGYSLTRKEAANEAVSYADALIEELKKTR